MRGLRSSFEPPHESALLGSSLGEPCSRFRSLTLLLVDRVSKAAKSHWSIAKLFKSILINWRVSSAISYLVVTACRPCACWAQLTRVLSDHKWREKLEILDLLWNLWIELRLVLRIVNGTIWLINWVLLSLPYRIQICWVLIQLILLLLHGSLIKYGSTCLYRSILTSEQRCFRDPSGKDLSLLRKKVPSLQFSIDLFACLETAGCFVGNANFSYLCLKYSNMLNPTI